MAIGNLSSVFSRAIGGDRAARDELIGGYRPLLRLVANQSHAPRFLAVGLTNRTWSS